MPPTESQILSTFLLPAALLPTILSLQKFTELVPRAQRNNPQVQILYRELQHQRALLADQVRENIADEVKKGEKQRRHVVKARRKEEREEMNGLVGTEEAGDVEMEVELFGPGTNLPPHRSHTLKSIIPEMEKAATDLEAELAMLEKEATDILAQISTTVGDLSDLRYGKFGTATGGEDVTQAVLNGLKSLEEVCEGS